jgi:hypothetical protein
MSLIITYKHIDNIFVVSDTRITKILVNENNQPETEYGTEGKVYKVGNIGYYMCWGTFSGIKTKLNLKIRRNEESLRDITDLKNLISNFLEENIKTGEQLEFGVHISGFTNNNPKIYHVFHGINIESKKDIKNKIYKHHAHDHSDLRALYNGKQKQAHYLISFLLHLERKIDKKVISAFNEEEIKEFLKMVVAYTSLSEDTVGGSVNIAKITHADITNIENTELSEIELKKCLSFDLTSSAYEAAPTGSVEP